MPKPTSNQRQQFRAFLRRQAIYEKRYQKHFLAYLRKTYKDAAKYIQENGTQNFSLAQISDNTRLENIFRRLYQQITLEEAKIAFNEVLAPLEENTTALKKDKGKEIEKKDIINDLIDILNPNSRGLINMWQSLLNNFLEVRLTNRITLINRTTEERIAKIIEDSIFEGRGAEDVARIIRKEAGGNLNVVRSRAIARTETITSANQGKYIAAQSSNLEMRKKWIPATDARTRPSHRAMYDNPWIDLEQDFWLANDFGVLEPAKHPCDERLSASNTVNCRCALVFEPKRDESGNLIRKN